MSKEQARERRLSRLKDLEQQGSLFHVNRAFLKILTTLIFDGGAARIGPVAFSTLASIRALVPVTGSIGFPSLETLSDLVGVSKPTIRKALAALEKEGLLQRLKAPKKGRTNVYALKEHWVAESTDGKQKAIIESDYAPSKWKEIAAELDAFERTGAPPEKTSVNFNIRNVQIIVNQNAAGATVEQVFISPSEAMSPEQLQGMFKNPAVRDAFEKALAANLGADTVDADKPE